MILEILLVIIATGLFIYFKSSKKNDVYSSSVLVKKTIPGMKASHPVNGNNDDIAKAGNMSIFLKQLHKKYGKIASFWEGKQYAVSFASPEHYKYQRQMCIVPYTFNKDFETFLTLDALIFQDPDEALRRRKLYDQFYMHKTCKDFTECFVKVAQEFTQNWKKCSRIDLESNMARASMASITRTSFGNYFKDDEHLTHFQSLSDFVMKNAEPPPEPGSKLYKQVVSSVEEIKSIVSHLIEERKHRKDDNHYLFIDLLLEEKFTESQRLSDSMGFIAAGYYTTSSLLTWTIYNLAKHPEVQEKMHEELVNVLGDSDATMESVPKLVFLRQVLDETLRMYPGSQFAVRETDQDTEIDGYFIPKRSLVYQAYSVIFNDPSIYPNPDKFDPDRFSSTNAKKRSMYAFKPFGLSGKRQCPGQIYAYSEATICLTEWCRKFRFHLEPNQTVTPSDTLMVAPLETIWVRLEARK